MNRFILECSRRLVDLCEKEKLPAVPDESKADFIEWWTRIGKDPTILNAEWHSPHMDYALQGIEAALRLAKVSIQVYTADRANGLIPLDNPYGQGDVKVHLIKWNPIADHYDLLVPKKKKQTRE